MYCKSWMLTVATLVVIGCGNNDLDPSLEGAEPTAAMADRGVESDEAEPVDDEHSALVSDGSDYYNCFKVGTCSSPSLSGSTLCKKDRDYHTSIVDRGSSVVVMSFHGGLIEPNSSEVARLLADRFGWSRYDLQGHGTSSCLNGLDNHRRMHITSTNFNDPAAVELVTGHKKGLSIHGYSEVRGNRRGTLCVGGRNSAQVQQFISTMNAQKSRFTGYSLYPVNSATASPTAGVNCSGLTGTARLNLVNRVNNDNGGLQLEMSDGLKADLVSSSAQYDSLRTVLYAAVSAAMSK